MRICLPDFWWLLGSKSGNAHATSDFYVFTPKLKVWASEIEFWWKWSQIKMLPQRGPKMLPERFEYILGWPRIKGKPQRTYEGHNFNCKLENLKWVRLNLFFGFGAPFFTRRGWNLSKICTAFDFDSRLKIFMGRAVVKIISKDAQVIGWNLLKIWWQ